METIVISSDRIKIMLTERDMENYCLDASDASLSEKITGKLLRKILKDAQKTVDFDSSSCRLHVQVYSSDKGCEMFVTRLEDKNERDNAQVFFFETITDAAMLCRRMSEQRGDMPVTVYYMGSSVFASFNCDTPAYACDYGSAVGERELTYISEYNDRSVLTTVSELSGLL